jgi:hypothetical protein
MGGDVGEADTGFVQQPWGEDVGMGNQQAAVVDAVDPSTHSRLLGIVSSQFSLRLAKNVGNITDFLPAADDEG